MAKKHATLSASAAHRWLNCTPAARLEETFAPTVSEFAEEGTAAHECAELCARYSLGLIKKKAYESKLSKLFQGKYYTEEMLEACQAYADLVLKKYEALKKKAGDAEVMLESSIRFEEWVPSGFGTADCLILADGYLEVIDFKYGKGRRVEAKGNPQMRLYALGAYATYGLVYEPDSIVATIFQPRLIDGETSEELSLDELLQWAENFVKPRAALAYEGKGDFNPSPETCKFCRAKATCRARAEENLKLFDDSPDAFLLTLDEAGALLDKADDISAWLEDLKKYVYGALMNGDPVAGWKLVEGRSVRRISDPDQAAKKFIDAGYDPAILYKPRELITLTQMEKDFGKKAVAEIIGGLIVKPQGAPTIARESDRRPEYQPEQELLKKFD